jgi:predicted MFS family arabinose efflux permease
VTRDGAVPYALLAVLWCAGLGAAGQFAKLSVPFEALRAAYPDAGLWLGPMVSMISGLGVVCGFFAGLLVARLGYRRLLLWALWTGAALSAVQALLPPVPLMLALRFVEGASHLVIVVAAPTLMAQVSPERLRPAVMSVWSTFFGVAFAATATLGLPLVATLGLPGLLGAHALWMAAVALAITGLLRGLPASARSAAPLRPRAILQVHLRAYSAPALSAPALGWFCYTLTYVALLTVLPAQLAPADRGWAAALMPLAGLAVSLSLGIWLLRFVSGVQLAMAGFALGAAGALWLAQVPTAAGLAVALMACLGLVQSGSFAAIPQLAPAAADQAQANGAMAQMGNLGNLLGTPLLLGLLALAGPGAIYWGLALAYLLGLGLHALQARRRARG